MIGMTSLSSRARWSTAAAAACVVGALLASPGAARANGGNSHTWISMHALEHLPEGNLKELLSRPELRAMLVNGSVYPDGGYVAGDRDYGETAHWEPFVEAYIRWIQGEFDVPLNTGEAAEHVAFLMGMASHGMADQVFDATFMEGARVYDADGWSDELLDSLDTATDVMLVAETGVSYLDILPWVPGDDLSALYRDAFGIDISPSQLDANQELLHRFVLNYAVSTAMDPDDVQRYVDRYPWSAANLMDPTVAGGPPCEGEIAAAYWLAIWDRLHDVSGPQNFVIATYPRDGSAGHPTDYTAPESQVAIVFGSGFYEDQLIAAAEIRDSTGKVYELEKGTQWGADESNLLWLRPTEDWAQDETFTVTLAAGLDTIDGFTTTEPIVFTFSTTATTEPADPTDDPTPHTGEPDVGELPPMAEDGGCSAGRGGAGAAGAWLAALGLLALRARRRRG
jgi:hypothetical protein